MKAALFSVRPEWSYKIASGEKTIEVRKTAPKLPTPYKGYLYCTLAGCNEFFRDVLHGDVAAWNLGNWGLRKGNVWAEFVCDSTDEHDLPYPAYQSEVDQKLLKESCLTYTELHNYIGSGNRFYGLHISELTIYKKPRELSEFRRVCVNDLYCESCAMYDTHKEICGSWCYVESPE